MAWGTTLHANTSAAAGTYGVTETAFTPATLSAGEAGRLGTICGFVIGAWISGRMAGRVASSRQCELGFAMSLIGSGATTALHAFFMPPLPLQQQHQMTMRMMMKMMIAITIKAISHPGMEEEEGEGAKEEGRGGGGKKM